MLINVICHLGHFNDVALIHVLAIMLIMSSMTVWHSCHQCHFNGVVSPCVRRRQLCKSHPQLPTTWGRNSN